MHNNMIFKPSILEERKKKEEKEEKEEDAMAWFG